MLRRLLIVVCALVMVPALALARKVVPIADVSVTSTATLVRAAASNREVLSCTNTSTSVNVRWGDASVTATKGQQIKAGASIEILTNDAIYMISEGATVTVACTEELR